MSNVKWDENIYVCDCGLKAVRRMIKRGVNAGSHFYSCSKWPHGHCSYFKSEDNLYDEVYKGKPDGEKRIPRERYETNTDDFVYKEKGDTFLTPFSSSFTSLAFISKIAQKANIACVESTLYQREIEGIDVIAKTKNTKTMQFMPILPAFDKVYNVINCTIKVLPLRKYWHTFNYYSNAPRIHDKEQRNMILKMYNDVMTKHAIIEKEDDDMQFIHIPIRTMATKENKSEEWITKILATHFAIQISNDQFMFMDRATFNGFVSEIDQNYLINIFNGVVARVPIAQINKNYAKYII